MQATSSGASIFPWWVLYIAFVLYGSLVPLDFQPHAWDQAWSMFQNIHLLDVGAQGRADWVANGVLYVPVGFLTVTLLVRYRTHPTLALALFGSLLFSVLLAVSVEFAQLFFPPRTVSLNDVIAEFIGSILGAFFALRWSDRFRSLLATLAGNSDRLLAQLLKAYAIGYVAFSLFPYDFLVTAAELSWKFHSDGWGWWVATAPMRANSALSLTKFFTEALAVVPLGWMLGQLTARQPKWTPTRALIVGAVLGLLIEVAQFFIVSGITQGISVLTRGSGMAAGFLLWCNRAQLQPSHLASALRRYSLPTGALYLILVAAVNGWFEHQWRGFNAAMLALDSVHFLPFYYHYYTTEQAALLSLASVFLLYAPIGVLTWATWFSPTLALLLATLTAGLMETSKLFLEGQHPDPTNLLLAGFAAWATAKLVKRVAAPRTSSAAAPKHNYAPPAAATRHRHRHRHRKHLATTDQAAITAETSGHSTDTVAVAASTPKKLTLPSYAALFACLLGVGWSVATFPIQPTLLGLFFTGYAALLWYRPRFLFIAIPAALALFDLAPWSGRFYFDEFDLLLTISVAIGYIRLPSAPRKRKRDPLFFLITALVGLAFAIATVRGLLPWQMPDANSFASYFSPYNAIRIAKGAIWAFLLFGLLSRMASPGQDVRRLFAWGMVAGLAGTVAVIVWERFAFPGLFNFTDVYRVTGPFSQMHTGGADIETYLTLSMPFLVLLLFETRNWPARLAGIGLLLGATYGVMVTFSRIGYVGYGVALTLVLFASIASPHQRALTGVLKRSVAAFALAALALIVAVPIFSSPFAQNRMSQVGSDMETRQAHWADALHMRDADWATTLFGMGMGRYPETHYWRSKESHAAPYRLGTESGNTFLRLGSGSPLYVEQFVAVKPQQDYALSLAVRSNQPNTAVALSICEKWLLTSARCVFKTLDVTGDGRWQSVQTVLPSGEIGSSPWYAARPVKLSIYNANAQAAIEVDTLHLRAADGSELLANGDFSRGLERWFFSVDNDKPWHIWSLPIQVLFDQGWLGGIALTLFVALGLWRAGRNAWRGDAMAGAMLAASVGFLIIGSLDSLVDSPRLLLLFLLLFWFCGRAYRGERPVLNPPGKLPQDRGNARDCG